MVDVVDLALAVAQVHERLDDREHVLAAQRAHRVLGVEVEAHVHLHAADGREVVALGVEEQRWNIASAVSSVGGSPGRMTR
jgi:hypothetical protein